MRLLTFFLSFLCPLLAQPWREPVDQWSTADAERVLARSPWSKCVSHGFTIRWEGALPVRLAKEKLGLGGGSENAGQFEITVLGLKDAPLKSAATLRYGSGDPQQPMAVRQGTQQVVFLFEKAQNIRDPGVFRLPLGLSLKRNEFEFVLELQSFVIRQRFAVKEMLYMGKLAL